MKRDHAGARPIERQLNDCRASILILGDSVAVGVGAMHPEDSLAGLLAQEFPEAAIANCAKSGATLAAVREQLATVPAHHFDLALILAGGNDVLRLSRRAQLERSAIALLQGLQGRARHVVWLGSADVGAAPLFMPPLSWWLSMRTRSVMRVLARCARSQGAEFVDFFDERARDIYADDGIHPSNTGYRRSYESAKRRTALVRSLNEPLGAIVEANTPLTRSASNCD